MRFVQVLRYMATRRETIRGMPIAMFSRGPFGPKEGGQTARPRVRRPEDHGVRERLLCFGAAVEAMVREGLDDE